MWTACVCTCVCIRAYAGTRALFHVYIRKFVNDEVEGIWNDVNEDKDDDPAWIISLVATD